MILAVWIWESRAWTEPQSALSKWWLDTQGSLLVLLIGIIVFATIFWGSKHR